MKKRSLCVIITTTDNKELATKLAQILLEQRLVACVQIDNTESFFEYEGTMQHLLEFRLTMKAIDENYALIEQEIKRHHNYQLPQIIKIKIDDGLEEYLNWVIGT